MTFLRKRTSRNLPDANTGESFCAKIVKKIVSLEEGLEEHPERVQFLVTYEGNNCLNKIVAYNQVLDALEADILDPNDQMWAFKDIVAHEGPLTSNNPSYKGSRFNVIVAWEDSSQIYEPLKTMAADNPAVCAVYAERANLLNTEGWKQSKLASYRTAPLFKFGYQVPRHHKEAITLDKRNGNTKYRDAEKLEMSQHVDYSTFKDLEREALDRKDTRRSESTLCTTSSTTAVTKLVLWLEGTFLY